ncbi:adenosylmethionine-8-amino-7-oxononanoate aminotransferase (mitochondrion) [Apiospora kogelbergensis]|uniref:Adenosylmethionine-8-amino-7-oxononanoate aminotransferase n=1 Tax=Apiospora kogelbergensis TaxID=1337665 RepID=A0AAW0QYI6_9PEZI
MEPLGDHTFNRDLKKNKEYPLIKKGSGNYLYREDGSKVFDAACGAAVACLGYGKKRVLWSMAKQMYKITYLASSFWNSDVVKDLSKELIQGTGDKLEGVYLTGSGSEAMEAAIKLSRQFFFEEDHKTPRVNYIARERSYHGNTLGALSISGFETRKAAQEPNLMRNVHFISSCYPYRQQGANESDQDFVARKVQELEDKFLELGPESVIGFIAEPIVGAALGCVPSPPGYLKGMRDVCHRHGALFILDEVMCGSGRTGTLHAWQAEDVVPDIQTMAKGLGAGYQPVAAMLVSEKVVKRMMEGSGEFAHGQTYQFMPLQAAAALEVQRIIRKDKLMENVSKQGTYLERRLKDLLSNHPNVGDIRGRGLFWGIEFVKDRNTSEPFDVALQVAVRIKDLGISQFDITVYSSAGCVDGIRGDFIMIAPAFTITKKDVDQIVSKVNNLVNHFFRNCIQNL